MALIKLKSLEEYLQGLDSFKSPKICLEQYETPAHIASCILYNIQTQHDDLEGKIVADLGSGCGMFTVGASLLGAQFTLGFELDIDAIDIFRTNVMEMEIPSVDCIQADVLQLHHSGWMNKFDTVITNPPFGTKNNVGMDINFVETAIHMSSSVVYSLHKKSTRAYILKKAKDWKIDGKVMAELRYNLDASYRFHKSKSVDIDVDLWRFDVSGKDIYVAALQSKMFDRPLDAFDSINKAMCSQKLENSKEERDINDIFDDIILTENRFHSEGYKEGFEEGCNRGNQEGYQLGYAQGLQLGQELGAIYGTVVAESQFSHTDKLNRALVQLRQAIDDFPRSNDPEKDIIGAVEHIRNLNKRVQAMLGTKNQSNKLQDSKEERKDYSF